MYWVTGSATAKNIRSTPMPAAKSIADQEKRRNCGREWSGPKRMLPDFEKATTRTKITATVAVTM